VLNITSGSQIVNKKQAQSLILVTLNIMRSQRTLAQQYHLLFSLRHSLYFVTD